MMIQQCTWSKTSIIITILVIAIMVTGGIIPSTGHRPGTPYIGILLWITLIAMCISALCFFPLKVEIDNGNLNIVFSLRHKRIPLSEIKHVEPYQITMNFVRMLGSGGFFGWWGWFRNQELGRFMTYASNLNHLMLIELTNGKRYVISCSNPEALTTAILDRRHQ